MRKLLTRISSTIAAAAILSAAAISAAAESYPSSHVKIPNGSEIIQGTIIGEENGWDGTPNTGCANAFDGDVYTYYDPTAGASLDCYAGMKLSEPYVLTKVCIMPREGWTDRFEGAMIQGSNDGKRWYTLWQSKEEADSWDWQVITEFKSNIGYTYYRYTNDMSHGDVAEVELYGYVGTDGTDPTLGFVHKVGEVCVDFKDFDGSKLDFETINVNFGDNYPEIAYMPERENYVFDGWYTSPEGGKKINSETSVTDPEDHTLYAHWITASEALELSKNDEDNENTENQSVHKLTSVQNICVTLSVIFVLGAIIFIIYKRS